MPPDSLSKNPKLQRDNENNDGTSSISSSSESGLSGSITQGSTLNNPTSGNASKRCQQLNQTDNVRQQDHSTLAFTNQYGWQKFAGFMPGQKGRDDTQGGIFFATTGINFIQPTNLMMSSSVMMPETMGPTIGTGWTTINAAAANLSLSKSWKNHSQGLTSFPSTLYDLLEEAESNVELRKIICWLPDGSGLKIHHEEDFCNIVMKKYFKAQTKFKSFTRQVCTIFSCRVYSVQI